jgi:hypothetical protein
MLSKSLIVLLQIARLSCRIFIPVDQLMVGVFAPQAAVLQDHILVVDIVAKPKTTASNPPLAPAGFYVCELLYVV